MACAAFAAASILFAGPALALPAGFAPALTSIEGDVEIGLSHERDENTHNGQGVKTEDRTAAERVRINTVGYLYHPRFLLFTIGGSLGLLQEDYDSNAGLSRRGTRLADEYNVRGILLPEHPYNLEVFTLRQSPFIKPRYSFVRPVMTSEGAIFRYKQRPLSLQLGFTQNSTDSSFTTDTRSYRSNLGYLIGPFSNSIGYNYSSSMNSFLMHTTHNDVFFSNDLSLPVLNLASQVRKDRMKQEDPRYGQVSDEILTWTEQLNAELPWNFLGNAGYTLLKDDRRTERSPVVQESLLFNHSENAYGSLSHRLYRSLWTTYTKNYTSVDTSSGDSDSTSDAVSLTYTKAIPAGKLTAAATFSRSHSDIDNRPVILDEVQRVTFLGDNPFTLNGRSIDQSTISIWVEDPSSGALLPLTVASYLVQPVGTSTQILIQPATLPFLVAPGSTQYRFHVSYSLLPMNVEFRTDYSSYRLTFDLLEGRVKPYAGFSSSSQEVLAGELPGGPDMSRSELIGIILQQKPYMVQSEFESVTSFVSPFRTFKNIFEYRDQIAQATTLMGRLSLIHSSYPQATVGLGITGYTETVKAVEVNVQRRLPRTNLDLVLGSAYTRRTSYVTSTAWTLNTALVWRLGKLTVDAGALINELTTVFSSGKEKMISEYYYLTVTRQLF